MVSIVGDNKNTRAKDSTSRRPGDLTVMTETGLNTLLDGGCYFETQGSGFP